MVDDIDPIDAVDAGARADDEAKVMPPRRTETERMNLARRMGPRVVRVGTRGVKARRSEG